MDQIPAQKQQNAARATNFNEDQEKAIAQFFVANYEIMSREGNETAGFVSSVNKERQRLLMQLTADLNSKYGGRYTYSQVHRKLKNLKQNARNKLKESDFDEYPFLDDPEMMEAEEIIMKKLLDAGEHLRPSIDDSPPAGAKRRQSSAARNLFGNFLPLPQRLLKKAVRQKQQSGKNGSSTHQRKRMTDELADLEFVDDDDDEEEDDDFDDDDDQLYDIDLPPPRPPPPPRPSPPKKRQRTSAPTPAKTATPAKAIGPEIRSMKLSVLRLQKQVLENELQVQAEKKSSVTKFSIAVDEFRRYVAEQRMASRGCNLHAIPVDIPPGMEDLVSQL